MATRQEVIDIANSHGWTVIHVGSSDDKSVVCSVEQFRMFLDEDRGERPTSPKRTWVPKLISWVLALAIGAGLATALFVGPFQHALN